MKDDEEVFDDNKKRNDTVESDSSVDIDEIIHRVAPNLSRVDFDNDEDLAETLRPSKPSALGEFLGKSKPTCLGDYLERGGQLSRYDKFSGVLNSPMLHQTVYVSVTNLDECDDQDQEEDTMATLRTQLESSPNLDQLSSKRSSASQLPSPIQFSLPSSTSSLNVPGALSLSSSPNSQLEDYLSLCSSLDSYKTIINDDSDSNI